MYLSRWMICATLLLAGGCVVGSNSTSEHTGIDVSDAAFAQITVGRSTKAEIKATLGEPSVSTTDGDTEVWRYTSTEHGTTGGYIFLVFESSHTFVKTVTTYVEFHGNLVDKKWRA